MYRRSGLALILVICAAANAPAADILDLIPADALGGVTCRSISELVKKSEKLIKDVEFLMASPKADGG